MSKRYLVILFLLAFVPAAFAAPATRAIPGINAKDAYPSACVSCHMKRPDGTDMRLSTLLGGWNGKVDAKKLAAMQAFVPKGMTLKGKHPMIAVKEVPASCMKCHSGTSKGIPPFPPLIHGIHLAKGDQSEFVKQFQGECTHCHKLDKATATWSLPSGAEK